MRLFIRHRTTYIFDLSQERLVQLARLTPPSVGGQTVLSWDIDVTCDALMRKSRDGYGNKLTMLYIDGPVEALTVEVSGEVLTENRAGVVGIFPEPLPPEVFLRDTDLTQADPAIRALAGEARTTGATMLDQLHGLMRILGERVRFDTGNMDVTRSAAQALHQGHGVCQDLTHLFVAAARTMNVPARYVSGHLFRQDGETEQAAAHAWAEAWADDIGWVGFDPANGISPDGSYVRVAVGLDYREAAPLSGARVGGGREMLDVTVTVVQAGLQAQT